MTEASRRPAPGPFASGKAANLALLALAQVLALALWFSGTAAVPALTAEGLIVPARGALFTSAVQIGFVVGTLASAILGLPDRLDPRRLSAAAMLGGAIANAAILWLSPGSDAALVMRFLTGVGLAGVYPVGMKLAAGWARGDMGLVVGLLVGALTVGSAAPHLFNAFGGLDWRFTLAAASASALLGAVLILALRLGPGHARSPRFEPGAAFAIWRNRGTRFATLGYLGHMWELYAMWAWIGAFLAASFTAWGEAAGIDGNLAVWAGVATFATIAAGGIGGVGGGLVADRFGRTTLTIGAMAISGACCLAAGALFGVHPAILVPFMLVWGVTVVADSAQFSSAVAELSEPQHVGTMLTIQTCLGFTLTLATIQAMPWLVEALGWHLAFAPLAIGPALGCLAMWRLKRSPMARHLAGGRG